MQIVAKKVLKMENVKAKAHGVIPLVYDTFDASHGLVSNPRRGHSQLALISGPLTINTNTWQQHASFNFGPARVLLRP